MSSVRNRILQFQQNSSNGNGTSSSNSANFSNGSSSSSTTSLTTLKSSYVRNGSIPPDIVATTVSQNQEDPHRASFPNKRFGNGNVLSNNNTNYTNTNNNSSSLFSTTKISTSTANTNTVVDCGGGSGSTYPYASSQKNHSNNNPYFGNSYGSAGSGSGSNKTSSVSSSPLSSSVSTSTLSSTSASSRGQVNIRKFSGNFSSTDTLSSLSSSVSPSWSRASSEKKSPAPEPSQASIVRTVEIPLKHGKSEESFGLGLTPPAVNRANKPSLATKKASMTINLSSLSSTSASSSPSSPGSNHNLNGSSIGIGTANNGNSNGSTMNLNGSHRTLPSPTRPKARTPVGTSPAMSAIPKLNSPAANGNESPSVGGFRNGMNGTHTPTTIRYRDPSPGRLGRRANLSNSSNRTSPATTPTGSNGSSVAFGSTYNGSGGGTGRFYQSIGWKEKFEESEKKRNHLVTLAQRATRDYEELRRRYHELYTDHEKVVTRFESATSQLESLRKASEATYQEYHKLKRRYEAENQEKSEALTRVDEYNKENRRLKRQSALMMQQIDPSTLLAHANLFDAVPEGESTESDKEIQYLRTKIKEMEAKIIDLETELERLRLSEFESQESVLLMNDSIQSSKNENVQLKEQLRKVDEENRKLGRLLEDLTLAHESLKQKQSVDEEKLEVAESELKKLLTEKNILQRQSLVFMNNEEMDKRLLDALAQIDELQRTIEEQKNSFESQIIELQNRLSEKELEEETIDIQNNAKIKALEEEVMSLRQRAEEAERKLEDSGSDIGVPTSAPPPPPPPPPMGAAPPPPPPPPPALGLSVPNGGGLGSSLQAAMGTLKKSPRSNLESTPNGSCDGSGKSLVSASPQIDDIVSQLKQGIKLRHIDRTVPRKQSPEKSKDENPVENLRSVLDNMRRTKTVDRSKAITTVDRRF